MFELLFQFMKIYKLYTKTNTFLLQPDPLIETLESVVGGRDHLDGRLQAAEAETEVIVFTFSRILFQLPYE